MKINFKNLIFIVLINLLISTSCLSDDKNDTDINTDDRSHVVGEPSEEELKERRIEKLATLPYSHPPPDPTKTRLLIYEYDAISTVHIHNPFQSEDKGIKVETKAKYHFELLNHDDHGNILARYQVYECLSGPCNNVPDVYVYFVQGGQNLLGVYVKEKKQNQKPDWGLTLAIAYAIQSPAKGGEGDEQIVKTPYGRCRQFFARPDDKIFTRKFDLCDFDSQNNYTLVPDLVSLDYQQFVEYKQNKKIDADMVFIEADEQFFVQSKLDPQMTLRIHSHLSLEMMNRTRRYMKRYCPSNMLGNTCATEVFGAKILGKNWVDVNKKLKEISSAQYTLEEFIKDEYTALEKCKSQNCPELFRKLSNIIKNTDSKYIIEKLNNSNNKNILSLLLNAIAIVGPTNVWKSAFKHAQQRGQNYAQNFVNNLAFTTEPPTAALKEIMKLKNDNDNSIDFYNTIGYLTYRRCTSTPSNLNSCNLNKDKYLNRLLDNTDKLTVQQQSKALWHLYFKSTATYFSQFLCSNDDNELQHRAITFYNKLHSSLFDRSINMKLLRIFWNTCPNEIQQSDSALALNVLVKIAPNYPTVGSYLLRSETINPINHHLWSLFYQKVEESIRYGDHDVRRYWTELRQLKPFRPNYLHRSLNSKSSSIYEHLENISLPLTIKGFVINDKESIESLIISASSSVPVIGINVNKNEQILTTGGFSLSSKFIENPSLYLRQFSQEIRLLAGYTINLGFDVISSYTLNPNMNLDLSLNFNVELLDENQIYGNRTHISTIKNIIHLKNERYCPIIHVDDSVIERTETNIFNRRIHHSNSQKVPGFSLNLGKNVNNNCQY